MITRTTVISLSISVLLLVPILPLAAPSPSVGITTPSPGDESLQSTVTVSGTASGSETWWNQTEAGEFNGTCCDTVIMNNTGGEIGLCFGSYDDFGNDTINTTKWTTESDSGMSVSQAGGELIINGTATSEYWTGSGKALTPAVGYTDFSADVKIDSGTGDFGAWIELYQDKDWNIHFGYLFDPNTSTEYWFDAHQDGPDASGWGTSGAMLSGWHNLRIIYDNSTDWLYLYGDGTMVFVEQLKLSDYSAALYAAARAINDSVDARFDNVYAGYSSGIYNSSTLDTSMQKPQLRRVNWTADTPANSLAGLAIRSSASADMGSASGWIPVANMMNCSLLALGRYIQYEVILSYSAPGGSPLFQSVSLQLYKYIVKVEVSPDRQNWSLAYGTTDWSLQMSLPDGTNTVFCRATDALGDIAESNLTLVVDTTPATVNLSIDGGAGYAPRQEVSLDLQWNGPVEITEMQISNTPAMGDVPWEPFQKTLDWNLADGDGTKTVYGIVRDRHGLSSMEFHASIILDTVAPTGKLTVQNGALMTLDRQVNLSIDASDQNGVPEMQLSNSANLSNVPWVPLESPVCWNLTAGPGTKTVYCLLRDPAGHLSSVLSDSILLITEGGTGPLPTAEMRINDDTGFVQDASVTLNMSIAGGSATWMHICNDPSEKNPVWVHFMDSIAWNLPEGDGPKIVHGEFATPNGAIFRAEANVVLDTIVPTGTLIVNDGEPDTCLTTVKLLIQGDDANGIARMEISNDPDFTGAHWEPFAALKNWTLPDGDGNKVVYVLLQDPAGMVSEPITAMILLDTKRPLPTGTIIIDDGNGFTNSTNVTLALKLDKGSLSGRASMMISNFPDFSGAVWEKFSRTRNWTLLPGDGNKSVYVMFDADRRRCAPVCATIVLDTEPPVLPLLDLYERSTTNSSCRISGSVEPGCELVIAGVKTWAGIDGRFEAYVPLKTGQNILILNISDPAGNTNTTTLSVTRTAAPGNSFQLPLMERILLIVVVAIIIVVIVFLRPRK